jgi:hypothetical protein
MDDNLENKPVETSPATENRSDTPDVGFPLSQPKQKSKSGIWVFIVVLIIILAGGLIFFLSKNKTGPEEASPTPETQGLQIEQATEAPVPTPGATLSPADKAKLVIEVQNGTGITGEAAYLQGVLKGLGYTDIKVGNSATQNNTITSVTFSSTLDKSAVQELTTNLDTLYQQVDTQTSTTLKTDALIVTGLRKGATAKPSASVGASASPSASPIATP